MCVREVCRDGLSVQCTCVHIIPAHIAANQPVSVYLVERSTSVPAGADRVCKPSTRHRKKPGYIRCRASAHGIGAHGMPSLAGGPRVHAEGGRPFLTLRTAPRAFRSSCGCFTKTVLVMTERGGKRHLERMYVHARMGQQLPRMHRFHWWDDPSCATTTAAVCTGGQAAWHSSCGPRRSLRCGPPPVT